MRIARNVALLIASLGLLAGCCDCKHMQKPAPKHRAAPAVNAAKVAPASHNACVSTFKFTPGTEQYTKCISSLRTLETK